MNAHQAKISIAGSGFRIRAWVARASLRVISAPAAACLRAMAGSSSVGAIRGYRREGFPEHELQQLMSGHRDRFEGL